MGIDKFGRSSIKKMQGPRGPPGPIGERGLRGEKGEKGEKGELGEGVSKTLEGDFDIEGKRVTNIGIPVHNSDAATVAFVKQSIFKVENPLWREMSAMKEFIENENKKFDDKISKIEKYLLKQPVKVTL